MNRHCGGTWFTVPGSPMRHYRCLLDGTILSGALAPAAGKCPHCRRPVRAWNDGATVEADVRTVVLVRVPPFDEWQELRAG